MSGLHSQENRRLILEKKTIRAMITIFCRGKHVTANAPSLCEDCEALMEYALARLDRCPFSANKPPCAKCSVHCYKPSLREQIKVVMRYSGPRMIWKHPILALWHWLDGYRRHNP